MSGKSEMIASSRVVCAYCGQARELFENGKVIVAVEVGEIHRSSQEAGDHVHSPQAEE